ncbi:MAG: hypothetical protein M3N32_07895 [Actinomycetota bacterium]|nr:hypothetical protein [Actinomycetota bacterium]
MMDDTQEMEPLWWGWKPPWYLVGLVTGLMFLVGGVSLWAFARQVGPSPAIGYPIPGPTETETVISAYTEKKWEYIEGVAPPAPPPQRVVSRVPVEVPAEGPPREVLVAGPERVVERPVPGPVVTKTEYRTVPGPTQTVTVTEHEHHHHDPTEETSP